MFTGHFLRCNLKQYQIDIGLPKPLFILPFKNYGVLLTEECIKQLWRFADEYIITLNLKKTTVLTLGRLGDKLPTSVLIDLGFKSTNLIHLNRCIL